MTPPRITASISCPCGWRADFGTPNRVDIDDPDWDRKHAAVLEETLAEAKAHLAARVCALGVLRSGSPR